LTHNNLGRTLQDQGKLAEAIAEYQKAIQLKPEDALAHNRLGRALQDQGKLAEAIIEFKNAIQLKPDESVGYSNLGFALQVQGLFAEAIAEYKKAIRLKSDDAKTLKNLAWALVLSPERPRPEYDEGLKHARRAVELATDCFNLNTLALAEYRVGHSAESIAASEKSIALQKGGSAYDWFLAAMARSQKGDKNEARQWFDKAVASDPKSKNAELRQFWAEAAELLGQPGPGTPADSAADKPR
jgi:tetratricopeptide (TPR) repeat protein